MRKLIALILLLCLLPAAVAENGETAAKVADPQAGTETAELDLTELPPGYVYVQAATAQGWLPLPTEGEISFPLVQTLPDGTETTNIIHLTPTGVYMENSTCEGQDCVHQGEVNFDNIHTRILDRYILCLPNQVSLELWSTEELLATYGNQAEADEAVNP